MLLSIVIPCHNEAAVLPETHRRLAELAEHLKSKVECEFIFVDDGSRDETARVLHELAEADPRLRGLRLLRNFGQQIATTAGLENAAGDAVVVMDADAPRRTILSALAGVPAIATAIAGHIGRRGCGHGSQRGRAGNGAQSKDSEFHSHLHRYEVEPPFPEKQTAEHLAAFRREPERLKLLLAQKLSQMPLR